MVRRESTTLSASRRDWTDDEIAKVRHQAMKDKERLTIELDKAAIALEKFQSPMFMRHIQQYNESMVRSRGMVTK